ncbi:MULTISPECIES: ribonuclease D [Crateriforma]|uniref:Ribonuclease D n=1 Tax=Crateriforma conspicua TaxID=2527996 RepID=A0A5C6FRF5_9PLAN|nr:MULTISPECIES: HRDC domain-containing protein [Crateriforma]TWU64826.1 Ribonuclease D [Crateriforma conspicua]
MQYQAIKTPEQLNRLCDQLAQCDVIGFDTEFVSEDSYRPELCLIQVAADDVLAVIDPYMAGDTTPFWELLAEEGRTVLAHAAREESRFCFRFAGRPIAGLFDTQLSAGFVGIEYPASLGTLVQRLLNKKLPKGETRTDWRERPLSDAQLDYALQDVTDLRALYDKIRRKIDQLGRQAWVDEETQVFQEKIIRAETQENWRRVSGSSGLRPRQLEMVRQLWLWRESVAQQWDRIPKRVLRDDLIVELARRGSTDLRRIRSIRGMERRNLQSQYENIAAAIQKAIDVPDEQLPQKAKGSRRVVSPMLSQFLSTSIACISRQHRLSPSIVGNAEDVRELLGYELDPKPGDPTPSLLKGWRGEIVGKSFRQLLAGELAIRVADVKEAQPLEFISVDP